MPTVLRPTPFDEIPWSKFWPRALPLGLGLLPIWIAGLGFIAQLSEVKGHLFVEDIGQYSPLGAGLRALTSLMDVAIRPPLSCITQSAQSNFSKGQCEIFWDRATIHGGVVIGVVLAWILVGFLLAQFFRDGYSSARQALLQPKQSVHGKAVGEAAARPVWLGWILNWRAVQVTTSQGQRAVAWAPVDGQRISVGDPVTLVPWKKVLGAQQFVLERHQPQMTIIQGGARGGSARK